MYEENEEKKAGSLKAGSLKRNANAELNE